MQSIAPRPRALMPSGAPLPWEMPGLGLGARGRESPQQEDSRRTSSGISSTLVFTSQSSVLEITADA